MIQEFLKGKSKEEIKDSLKGLSNNEIIEKCFKFEIFELLPRDENGVCVYDGNLKMDYGKLTTLPDNLTVNGDFICMANNIKQLPKKLTVTGLFECSGNELEILSDDLKVGKTLHCSYNRILFFNDNLTVNGDFSCDNNYLTELPENLTVYGHLDCRRQKSLIKLELPDSAVIKGKFIN